MRRPPSASKRSGEVEGGSSAERPAKLRGQPLESPVQGLRIDPDILPDLSDRHRALVAEREQPLIVGRQPQVGAAQVAPNPVRVLEALAYGDRIPERLAQGQMLEIRKDLTPGDSPRQALREVTQLFGTKPGGLPHDFDRLAQGVPIPRGEALEADADG